MMLGSLCGASQLETEAVVYVVYVGTMPQLAFPGSSVGKESACRAGDVGDSGSFPWFRKIPWRRARQPTPVFLPGELHGQRSLAGCSPQGGKESDTSEATHKNRDIRLN